MGSTSGSLANLVLNLTRRDWNQDKSWLKRWHHNMDLTGPKNHDLAGLKNTTIAQHLPATNINNTQDFSAHISTAFVFLLHQLFVAPRFFISFHLILSTFCRSAILHQQRKCPNVQLLIAKRKQRNGAANVTRPHIAQENAKQETGRDTNQIALLTKKQGHAESWFCV